MTPWGGVWLAIAVALLTACGSPPPTPLPVAIVVNTPIPPPQEIPPIRYWLSPAAALLLTPALRIEAGVEFQIVPADPDAGALGITHDVYVTLGDLPESLSAPAPLELSLIVGSAPPLDDPAIAAVLLALRDRLAERGLFDAGIAVDPGWRTVLANAGYPDGFVARVGIDDAPLIDLLSDRLRPLAIPVEPLTLMREDAIAAWRAGDLHLALTRDPSAWVDAGAQPTIIARLPIRYRAAVDLVWDVGLLPRVGR